MKMTFVADDNPDDVITLADLDQCVAQMRAAGVPDNAVITGRTKGFNARVVALTADTSNLLSFPPQGNATP